MSRKILIQVTAPAVIVGLLLFFACLVSAWHIRDMQANLTSILKENVSSGRAAQQMEIAVRQLRWHTFNYLIAPSPLLDTKIQSDVERFDTWLELAQETANTPEETELVNKIRQAKLQYLKEFEKIKAHVDAAGPRRDFENLDNTYSVLDLVTYCRDYLVTNDRLMTQTAEDSERLTVTLNVVLVLLGLVAPLAGILSGYGIARTLSRSIYKLSVQVQDMAHHLKYPVGSLNLQADGDIADLDQHLQNVVHRVEEVTGRLQKQQRELMRAQQLSAVGQLAASVAHEIRNPLTAVKMLVGVALRQQNRKDLTEDDLQVIYDEVGRVEKTVQNLLTFARLPAPCRARCDLREVAASAVELMRGRAVQQEVTVSLDCPDTPVSAEVDRGQIGTVLMNLFMNALDAMPQGGRLQVVMKAGEGLVEIRVSDTGKGIANDMFDKLFAPFASDKPTGTGLGLNLSRRIIEEHGGTLTAVERSAVERSAVESMSGGACFQITLPANIPESTNGVLVDH